MKVPDMIYSNTGRKQTITRSTTKFSPEWSRNSHRSQAKQSESVCVCVGVGGGGGGRKQQDSCWQNYHWRELPQIFLSRQKYACRDKSFVTTNICRYKHNFVATSILLSRQKTRLVATNTCLSRQILVANDTKWGLVPTHHFWYSTHCRIPSPSHPPQTPPPPQCFLNVATPPPPPLLLTPRPATLKLWDTACFKKVWNSTKIWNRMTKKRFLKQDPNRKRFKGTLIYLNKVSVKINKRSFEPFCVWLLKLDSSRKFSVFCIDFSLGWRPCQPPVL